MSILITGALGGLGSQFSAWARNHFSEEVVLTDHGNSTEEGYILADLSRPEEVNRLIARVKPTITYHLAGSFNNDYITDYEINALSAKYILDALMSTRCRCRLLLCGSAAEYGIVTPDENPLRETHLLRPVTLYGLTKALQTQMAYLYSFAHQCDVVVGRIFNLFSEGLSERLFVGRMQKMIQLYTQGHIDCIEVGNLESRRDYVDIQEVIRLFELITQHGISGEVYHVASGNPVTMRELLDHMLTSAGLEWAVIKSSQNLGSHLRTDVPSIYADMTKTYRLSRS
jgi:GDP-4-dehydro-6-deoxy-D-mannose reductase